MPTSLWTETRVARLFERYRCRYWPASRRLLKFHVQASSLGGFLGRCEIKDHVLLIDVSRHSSDRAVRATLLHEMVHAVVGGCHNASFWMQLEYLLKCGAPITVGFPELGERGEHLCIIPSRFRRCRRMFRFVYKRRQREISRMLVTGPDHVYTYKTLEVECEDQAINGASWRVIWAHHARLWGFVDLDDRLLPWARAWRAAARRGFVRGRRFYLSEERHRAAFALVRRREKGGIVL